MKVADGTNVTKTTALTNEAPNADSADHFKRAYFMAHLKKFSVAFRAQDLYNHLDYLSQVVFMRQAGLANLNDDFYSINLYSDYFYYEDDLYSNSDPYCYYYLNNYVFTIIVYFRNFSYGLANCLNFPPRCSDGTQPGDRHTTANGYRKSGAPLHLKTNPSLIYHRSSDCHSFSNADVVADYLDSGHRGDTNYYSNHGFGYHPCPSQTYSSHSRTVGNGQANVYSYNHSRHAARHNNSIVSYQTTWKRFFVFTVYYENHPQSIQNHCFRYLSMRDLKKMRWNVARCIHHLLDWM